MLYQYKEKALQMNATEQEEQRTIKDNDIPSIEKTKVKKL